MVARIVTPDLPKKPSEKSCVLVFDINGKRGVFRMARIPRSSIIQMANYVFYITKDDVIKDRGGLFHIPEKTDAEIMTWLTAEDPVAPKPLPSVSPFFDQAVDEYIKEMS